MDKVRAASKELGDRGKLAGIELLQQGRYVSSQWAYHVVNVRALHCQVEDLFTPIVRVRFTTQVPSALESGDHTGDRATSQAGDRCQIATSHCPSLAEQIEALVIGRAQS